MIRDLLVRGAAWLVLGVGAVGAIVPIVATVRENRRRLRNDRWLEDARRAYARRGGRW